MSLCGALTTSRCDHSNNHVHLSHCQMHPRHPRHCLGAVMHDEECHRPCSQSRQLAHGCVGFRNRGTTVAQPSNRLACLAMLCVQDTAGACCDACQAAAARGCNVWVWCGEPDGCGGRQYTECWLKRQRNMLPSAIAGQRGEQWTQGAAAVCTATGRLAPVLSHNASPGLLSTSNGPVMFALDTMSLE
jgi:hypothetical protein